MGVVDYLIGRDVLSVFAQLKKNPEPANPSKRTRATRQQKLGSSYCSGNNPNHSQVDIRGSRCGLSSHNKRISDRECFVFFLRRRASFVRQICCRRVRWWRPRRRKQLPSTITRLNKIRSRNSSHLRKRPGRRGWTKRKLMKRSLKCCKDTIGRSFQQQPSK